ncbi:MAG: TVP38/TMEM64 family protein [Planctomycetes bacterium]|nr:TVP38/TMEM64 family protein [Planctomycetota bacterium]
MGNENEQNDAGPRPDAASGGKGRAWRRPALLVGVLVALFAVVKALGLGEKLGDLRDWIDSLGALGPAVFVLLYAGATVAAIPGSALTVAAGALFGSLLGVVCVSIGSTLGAALCFLIARHFARGAVARWLSGSEKFRRLDRLTKEHGTAIVAITRLAPIFPFNLLNYGFGLTRVPFGTYIFWSWLCMLPGTILYVVGADAVVKGLAQGRVPWGLVAILVVAILLLALLVRSVRRRSGVGNEDAAAEAVSGGEDTANE